MTTALEQSFRDLLAKHDLLSLSVTAHGSHFSVSVQWRDETEENGRGCEIKNHATNIGLALGKALAAKHARAVHFSDQPLTVEAA